MRKAVLFILLAGVLAVSAPAQEDNPLAVLQSDASLEEKMNACRALSLSGDASAVPALAALLDNPELAHMARYALEPMPCPEADAALRAALMKTSGNLKIGVISSIGVRRDAQAVPALAALLSDADAEIVRAAALALGAIATPEAAKALADAIAAGDAPAVRFQNLSDGLLACAEHQAASGRRDEACATYDGLLARADAPRHVRAAALRGAILMRDGDQDMSLLTNAMRGEDPDDFRTALRAARELEARDQTAEALAAILPTLPDDRKVPVMGILGILGGEAAGKAALAEARQGLIEVRTAALAALAQMGHRPGLELMMELSWTEDGDLAKSARNALSYFPGEEGDAAVLALLRHAQPLARLAAVEMIGQGALEKPANVLMPVAKNDKDKDVRMAALRALQESAGLDELPALLEVLKRGRTDAEKQAAERALGALVQRQKRMPVSDIVIQKAVYGDLPDGKSEDVKANVERLLASGAREVAASNENFGDPAPNVVKRLLIEYTGNGEKFSKMVQEGETLKLAVVETPQVIVDAFLQALNKAPKETRPALLELLGSTGSHRALEAVRKVASKGDGEIKEAALRTLCDWPTLDALPVVMDLVRDADDPTLRVLAQRGALRLLEQGNLESAEFLGYYAELLARADDPGGKKAVFAGLAKVQHPDAFDMVLRHFADESVKAEALQAAVAIARNLGKAAREDQGLFNGQDLSGWTGNAPYWRVEDGAIVGHSDTPIPRNEFIWSDTEIRDFYLVVSVKLEPNTANAGIQFRSKKVDDYGQALGYQADVGQDVWGRLYHEHGRGKLDWTDAAEQAVKPGEWNRYEILAVGPAIWTAINGKLGVACLDIAQEGERSGWIALQVHSGPPQTVRYRIVKLVHDPKVELEGIGAEELVNALRIPER